MRRNKQLPSDQQYDEEADLLEKVMNWLAPQKRDGIMAIRICDRYNKGYSDVFICVHGILVLAELKDNTGTATPHQLNFIREMRAVGAVGGVCRSVKDVSDLIEEAKQKIK